MASLPITAAAPSAAHAPRPTWYGTPIAREQRSWLSRTGDVDIIGGRTFPTTFRKAHAALEHARAASDGEAGAVAIMRGHGRYFLTRAYNAELTGKGFVVGQTQLDGREKGFTHRADGLVALVDGERVVHWHPHHP